LFRNGGNQAVRIPIEFELPGQEAIMHRDGDRLVIEPLRKRGLTALLKMMKPLRESLPVIDDPVPEARLMTRYDVQAWFDKLDEYLDEPFMPNGRREPSI
jgi:antitoxin VapB